MYLFNPRRLSGLATRYHRHWGKKKKHHSRSAFVPHKTPDLLANQPSLEGGTPSRRRLCTSFSCAGPGGGSIYILYIQQLTDPPFSIHTRHTYIHVCTVYTVLEGRFRAGGAPMYCVARSALNGFPDASAAKSHQPCLSTC